MRNIILAILILCSLGAFAQRESKVSDSTRFTKGVRFDSTLVFKRLKAAAVKDTVLVIMDANGTVSKINKSNLLSVISGGGSQTLSISGDTLSISDGNSVVLPVYVQADSSTISSYDVLNSQNAPPGSPAIGDTYLVGNSPSGAWAGHSKDIAEWNGSAWVFTDGVQGDFLYNATNALTYIFRSGNWVQTTGIPALNKGNTISTGLTIGTRNNKDFNFISNNILRGGMLANGSFRVANQGGSGNVLVGANSLGVQRKLYIGDGLSLSNDSLLASGGGGSYIPLSGTEVGSPVTGDIEFNKNSDIKIYHNQEESEKAIIFSNSDKFINIYNVDTVNNTGSGLVVSQAEIELACSSNDNADNTSVTLNSSELKIVSSYETSRGITSTNDFTPYITDLDYPQKKYVDTHIADTANVLRSLIPDVSSYATITNLKDSTALVRGLITSSIPTFSLSKSTNRDSIVTIFNGTRTAVKDSLPTVSATSTTTFTNKRITARVDSTTSSATPTINTDNVDTYKLTAQAADITSFTTNLSGTPTDDQILHIVIIGTAARAITWGAKFESSTVTLPTTTVSTNRLDVYFIWNTATSKWRCGGVW